MLRRLATLWLVLLLTAVPVGAIGQVDTEAPKLHELSISPHSVNVGIADADVTIHLHLTDNLSGVGLIQVNVRNANGSGYTFIRDWRNHIVAGTPLDGVWEGTITVPAFSRPSQLTATMLIAFDRVGNQLRLSEEEMKRFGAIATITNTVETQYLAYVVNPGGRVQ